MDLPSSVYEYQITSMVASVWEITECDNKTKFKDIGL